MSNKMEIEFFDEAQAYIHMFGTGKTSVPNICEKYLKI